MFDATREKSTEELTPKEGASQNPKDTDGGNDNH